MSEQATPSSMSTKKRSLSSPEFNLDLKKNRVHISSLSESESDVSLVEDRNMASNIDTDTNTVTADTDVMADHSTPLTQLTLQDAHLKKIATFIEEAFQPKLNTLVQDSIQSQLAGLVTSIVNGVLEGLNAKITSLETENIELKKRISKLETVADNAEQYSRRNCLRISGINENPNECTDSIVLDLAKAIDVELKIEDIDRSHRLGKPGSEASPRSKPRDIIVKFATYRMRQKVYKSRTLTKERNYRRVFINEDLTILRSQLLYEARRRVKSKQLKSAWSSDGTILVKHIDDNGTVSRVTCESDLPAYVPLPNEPGTRSTR